MLSGKKIAVLIGPNFHDEEATVPRDFLREKNASVDLVGLDNAELTGKYGKITLRPDKTINDLRAEDYDAVIIPGGGAPERIRLNQKAIQFVQDFWKTGKPLAAICHGPQVLISAKLLKGVTLTSYEGIRDDIENVGGKYVDEQVHVDGQLITSRKPDDLPAFNETILKALTSGFLADEEKELDVLKALELAIAREKGAQEFYAGVAGTITSEKVSNKFKYLATIEETHFDQLSEMYEKLSGGQKATIDLSGSEIGKHKVSPDITTEEAIELAIQAEQKAYDFYRTAALKAKSGAAKEMFQHLAAEELEHKRLFSMDMAAQGGQGHFQWATHFDIPPGMDDLW